jgi:hypothetical protein
VYLQIKGCQGVQKLRRKMLGRLAFAELKGHMALYKPGFQTSGLKNCELIKFCYLRRRNKIS